MENFKKYPTTNYHVINVIPHLIPEHGINMNQCVVLSFFIDDFHDIPKFGWYRPHLDNIAEIIGISSVELWYCLNALVQKNLLEKDGNCIRPNYDIIFGNLFLLELESESPF